MKAKKRNQFKKGKPVSFTKLIGHIMTGNYIYWNHKLMHHGFSSSMTLRTLHNAYQRNILTIAIPNK